MTTTSAGDFDKISPTALLVAYARQFSNIPYTSDFTTKAGAGQMRQSDSALGQVNQKIMSLTGRTFKENEFVDILPL